MIFKFLQKNKNYLIKKDRGFVLLFAMMLSGIIFAITMGVANIAQKEIIFGTSAKDTNNAFFAADTGDECALFYDKINSPFNLNVSSPDVTITCAGSSHATTHAYADPTNNSIYYDFIVTGLGSIGTSCSKVRVLKDWRADPTRTNVITTVTSKGYSIADSSCNPNANSVERVLEVSY